ncbi:MAG: hypothetical protein K0R59_3103 [Sphingobacterium sp.]|jgi:hypothetical protein|uniref:hypothetical protein n=1 Tax=Sphingobacterium sp. CZ-UAM TaxID=1933868 RepID=UPI000986954F|nr:hypothetical protein [Sphingobacterium sp. CZ-UAM]MDF2517807.1 hypothetical protein [Sphingobacterium sp.]OOG16805.1 hypothetical protein BWD42_18480 [Sphingobacterium sp. CZ-UAM]
MNNLTTDNPVALQALMDETIFTNGFDFQSTQEAVSKAKDTEYIAVGIPSADHLTRSVPDGTLTSGYIGHEQGNNELEVLGGEFIYQGNKDQGILFILRYEEYPYFSPAALDAFEKTIGALKLRKETVAVVNLANAHNPNDFKRIMQFFQPTKIILLGVEPASLKLPSIEHNSYMKGRIATVFNTFSFEEMFADVNKKKLFWNEFKTFIVS